MLRYILLCLISFQLNSFIFSQQDPDSEQGLQELICHEQDAAQFKQWMGAHRNETADQTDMRYQEIHWELDPEVAYIKGTITYQFASRVDGLTQLVLDLDTTMDIHFIRRGNQDLTYQHTDDLLLTIGLGHTLNAGDTDSLTISYEGTPHSTGFGSFEKGVHNTSPIIWTQSVPYGVRDWWPGKQDLIDKIDSMDVFITTPAGQLAAGIGKLIDIEENNGKWIHHWRHRHPIVSYLIAVAVTNYVSYVDEIQLSNGDTIEFLNYVYPESLTAAQQMTPAAKDIMAFYVDKFGPYPFADEKFGHAQFSWGGGTEIQTMNFMTNFSSGLMAHEMAHQWFGDFVTCGSYEDTWLNEGFATYLTGLTYEHLPSLGSFNNWKSSTRASAVSEPGGSVFVNDTSDYARIFDSRLTYDKGAYVLHMLRWVTGDDAFFKGCKNYLHLPHTEYGFGRTRDLQDQLELTSGNNLDEFFADWYYGEGYPSYAIEWTQQADSVIFWISQATSHPSVPFFEMPVPIQTNYAGGNIVHVLQHNAQNQRFSVFVGNHHVSSVVLDPDKWLLSKNNTIKEIITATHDLALNPDLIVYPNPATHTLSFKTNLPIDQVELMNTVGFTRTLVWDGQKAQIPDVAPGFYMVRLTNADGQLLAMRKVVIR